MMERLAQTDENLLHIRTMGHILEHEELMEPKRRVGEPQDDLQISIENIEKMDVVLKLKLAEEKRARLQRIQAEEKSRSILASLPCPKISSGLRTNLEEFLRLLNEEDDSDSVHENEAEENAAVDNDRKGKLRRRATGSKFVERNIRLAKCGRGILSLTDEEKLRIRNLLADLEDEDPRNEDAGEEGRGGAPETAGAVTEDADAFRRTSRFTLERIDEKLEAMRRMGSFEECATAAIRPGKPEENEVRKRLTSPGRKPKTLKEIDRLLTDINSVTAEEVNPMSREEMEFLVKRTERCLSRSRPDDGERKCPGTETPGDEDVVASPSAPGPSREAIADLVTAAKILMPNFKYRFDDS